MARTAALWSQGARKETFELLEHLWTEGDEQIRLRLTRALANGPPDQPDDHKDPERQTNRDRLVFERIALLRRGKQPLPAELIDIYDAIAARHPTWHLEDGEQAKFNTWTESWSGRDSVYSVDDLRNIADNELLLHVLCTEQEHRDGLLENWRQLVGTEPDRGIIILDMLSGRSGGPSDIWRATLSALRERAKEDGLRRRLIAILSTVPTVLFDKLEYSRSVADLLDSLQSSLAKERQGESFWGLFDRALRASEDDPENSDEPRSDDWVGLAINRSLGHLATAFFSAIFAYQLRASDGIPIEHRDRLDELVGIKRRGHRLARVIAASRLPYLFAVYPDWTRATLIPSMDWANEDEATALWQGFAWQPRLNAELWAEIGKPFLASFTPERLARLCDSERTMAQLLMLAGIEFRREDLPDERARAAIMAMSPVMREDAIWWLRHYLTQAVEGGALPGERADALWRDRVQPWLKRAWPHERGLRSRNLSARFALLTTSTSNAFPEAVEFVLPFLIPTNDSLVLHELNRTNHPDQHPEATLQLLTAICVPPEVASWHADDLRAIVAKLIESRPALRDDPAIRRYQELLRLH
jgi:hypothetical protein